MTDQASSRILVTSALPYANGPVHLGHLAGAYLPADIFVRYQRLRGRDVVFICGSDEHGVSILLSAREEGVSPRDIIDRYHQRNKEAFEKIGMSFDNYSRTSLPIHHETALEFFHDLKEKGILKQRKEKQLFDEKAGMFLPDRFVMGTCYHLRSDGTKCEYPTAYGDQCEQCGNSIDPLKLIDPVSVLTGTKPTVRETTHWYFPLGDYQERLEQYVEEHADVWRENVLQQCRSWLKEGLEDRPITRDLDWGVPVPTDDGSKKVLYVWFEAVLGYISSTKEWAAKQETPDLWKEYWCKPDTRYIAFIGKDNIVFHCLMFPAMLMAKGGYVLPENVPANEFLNLEGRKFSKSRHWTIDLEEYLEEFPPDLLRYALALNFPETKDTDFYWKDFQARSNNELADILGNFINRTVHFAHKHFQGKVPPPGELNERDREFLATFQATADSVAQSYESYRFREGVGRTMNLARAANKYFNDSEPWVTIKSDPVRCATTINISLQAIHSLMIFFEPVLPFTSRDIRSLLGFPEEYTFHWEIGYSPALVEGHQLGEQKILFEKISDEVIAKYVDALGRLPAEEQEKTWPNAPLKSMITIDDFGKIDLRIAEIFEAERIKKSKKLLRLKVRIGEHERQIVAGIAEHYEPESLIGKRVVVVANLKSAKLFGVESEGMVLAATNEDGELTLLVPERDIETGSIVK
ncbi:MAG: methionine--tRNA ligase [Chlorobi bacterium]|nr:methionine--tRNA ligase [Chlorobiota bacterium]